MIDREKANKVFDALDAIAEIANPDFTLAADGTIRIDVWPKNWSVVPTEENRHKILGVLTPLVGKLNRSASTGNENVGYEGSGNGISIDVYRVDVCKIVGYKTVVKRTPKVIEVPDAFDEQEERIAITDCDLKAGRATEDQIEVMA